MKRALLVPITLVALAVVFAATGANGAPVPSGDWTSFGRTTDNNRHSPLTQITPANVSQLGREYTIDFQKVDPDVRRGEQSYPLAINGTLYVTTNDANVFAIDGATGKILWHFKPANSGLFKNFGIVANRGLAYCDDALYLLTLDMHLNKLNPKTGALEGRVAIADAVPGAGSNYGYSETSAPICANNRILAGSAGSEYGVRGFVMAWTPDLRPAWPNPVWTIPPELQSWRRYSRIAGGGVVWTPVTVDASTNTVYFGTGSATPLYFPSLRPGTDPRTDSLLAVDLQTGQLKWWRQLIAGNEWSYDVAQPPLVYTGRVGGRVRHVVSVATMEGVWYAFDANTGAPFWQRVKVIDRVEHPALKPGQPVVVYPSSLGGLNYSPASYDPATDYVFNAAAETAAIDIQSKLTPTQRKQKFVLGSVFLGLSNGNFGTVLPGWHDHGSISAINVNTGQRVWKFETPEPERGGVTTTASGIGFAGGGDGNLRAFNLRTGKVLWKFQTGHQIASGPTVFTGSDGKEYVAITVGGTPTSSNGGVSSWLEVFGLGGSQKESPPPQLDQVRNAPRLPASKLVIDTPRAPRATAGVAASAGARITTQGPFTVRVWSATRSNTQVVSGRLLLRGRPVEGAVMQVDNYTLRNRTNASGAFFYRIDVTLPHRHVVRVQRLSGATVGGRPLSTAQRRALLRVAGGFSVGYRINGVHARASGGHVVVTGRLSYADGTASPPVVLFTYLLQGTITDANGKPVQGATVVTRTQDRDFWTFSTPSDASGHYTSFFTASDESGANPVPLTVQVALGHLSYASKFGVTVNFTALRSATLNIKLPASGTSLAPPTSTSYPGAVYEGTLVGASGPGGVVKPLAATWPTANGTFRLVLPGSVRGKPLRLWEDNSTFFQPHPATPGGAVDTAIWPRIPPGDQPQGLAVVRAP
ncbi:MAG TPA: PQQ-binding-like beta-propeller repeat protein [Gaiellaceae bacterium]|nr:PQQ-binding-like beta-propeller repeat protein [Gaiellaceae bacterium]